MPTVAIYARYSSDRQNERSVGDQIDLCTRHAQAKGWTVGRYFSDAAISGSAMANRPGLLDAIAAAERGEYDILLCEDEDRIARSLENLAHVANRLGDVGARLWSISSGEVTTMHVAMKGLIAEDFLRNLSAKTKRGMNANAERGLATGSRVFGYLSEPGGGMTIVEGEAEIIRRIFADYVAGDTPRQIAQALNLEGVPGPRGGQWNQSSINGSRQRANGILNTELYAGVKVWNRMAVKKNRTTGKRTPTMLPEAEWKRTEVPHLRIVDAETWAAARERKGRLPSRPEQARRRPGVFSGLLRCGLCGGSYTVYTGGKLICSTYREKGTCTNRRTPSRDAVEARALESLRNQILSPEAVALYVRTYHRAAAARKADLNARRRPLEKRHAEVARGIERIVDAIVRGTATATMETKMMELEAERLQLEAQLAEAAEEPQVFELLPSTAEKYAAMVARLQETLHEMAGEDGRAQRQLIDEVRGLIDYIAITPLTQERGGPIKLTLHGTLARFMEEQDDNARSLALVAGARFGRYRPSVPALAETWL